MKEKFSVGLHVVKQRALVQTASLIQAKRGRATAGESEGMKNLFAGRHFDHEGIILCVR